jgi:hypothetical protein
MLNKRKEGACEEAAHERDLWDKANPYFVDRKYIKPEGYVDSPLYTSVNQLRKEKKKLDRAKAGLTVKPVYQQQNDAPTTAFVKSPVISSKSELSLLRKKRQLDEALESVAHLDTHVGMRERYLQRENHHVAEEARGANQRRSMEGSPTDPHREAPVRTQTALLKKRKEELLAQNMKTFANVHHELPKFADEHGDNKKWWTKRSDYPGGAADQ